ncbi:hypothetical protein IEQ34_016914 [Dendrobium chrysotoxum]|uniref:Uncharacterized protein n=1 Tax=Dendrobium chrysotoxum TaxID=161865 RepID=A0AAV7GFK5_DENCH|nr:hypothetical protein IEQ34_016914 [Dendrobium chrysotoxum]
MDPQQQMAAVLGTRPGAFEALISYLMSSDNEKRTQAESLFSLCRVHNPDVVALKLTHLLHSSSPHLRTMAAVLLRSHLTSHGGDCDAGLSRLNAITKASLKSLLLAAVQREESKFLTKQLCDVVAEVAAALLPENEWPELLPFMFQAVTSGSPHLQESSLLVFSRLSQCTRDPLLPHLANLHSVFLNSLSHPSSPDVRIAALGASISLVRCLPSAVDRDKFADLLPAMMLTLTESLNSGNEAAAQEALKLLIEFAGAEPKFLRPQLPHVVGSMLQIAEADALDESTRHLAIEFMITLAEARDRAPGMMRKLPQFIGRLFAVLMNMLLDIYDESTWHAAEKEDEDAWETDNYSFGQECLDRLSIAIGGTTLVPIAFELFPVYLASPDWQKHHAALITLAQIAEGCSKVLIKNLEQVVTMVLNSFQHPHPRVRWAAINAIRQLSTDLSPDLQVQYHQRVLPTLASAMDDFQNPRVQASFCELTCLWIEYFIFHYIIFDYAHAASIILNFTENCAPDIMTHYLDGFVSKLLVLLQNTKQIVQGAALTALASLADSSREQFQNYYDAVMPCLKTILLNATDKSNRMLLAKSMECISLVGMVVGKDKFRDDAKQVMEVLMSLQGSQIETDDPIANYMLQAWTRLCQCLGQDFLPYMNIVMPPLLQSAQLEPDVTITSADSEYMDDSNEDRVEIATLGAKRIGIRTSVLEEKATACHMLYCYADELKENFYPWIDQVAPTLVPLLKFYFHEEVRRAAVSAMPELLRSAKLAVEKGLAQGRDESYVKQLSDYIVPALVEALHKLSGHLLDKGQIRSIVDEIKHLITASTIRKRERAERMKAEDFDAEEGEFLKEENEQEEEVFDQVSDCLGTMIKTFKTYFVPFLDELSIYLKPMWGRDKTPKERRIAICIFDDVAEQCQESAHKYYDTYVPFLLEACNDGDAGAAVYGIGVCAEFGGLVFRPFVGEALYRLNNVISHADAFSSNNVLAYDDAVSALGKICLFHRDSIDAAQIIPAWLNCLPVKGDLTEAKIVHEQLCSMVERSDKELLGPNNQYLPKILSVFAEAILLSILYISINKLLIEMKIFFVIFCKTYAAMLQFLVFCNFPKPRNVFSMDSKEKKKKRKNPKFFSKLSSNEKVIKGKKDWEIRKKNIDFNKRCPVFRYHSFDMICSQILILLYKRMKIKIRIYLIGFQMGG